MKTEQEATANEILKNYRALMRSEKALKAKRTSLVKQAQTLLASNNYEKIENGTGGSIQWVGSTMTIHYDQKALDVLIEHDPELKEALAPHRSEKERKGYVKLQP